MSVQPAALGGPYASVFDVGAFRGDFARACLQAWPECVVHSFEPLEERPIAAAPVGVEYPFAPRWRWYPVALGNQCDLVTMYRNEFVPSSSVLPMADLHAEAFPYTRQTEEVRVGMVTLDEYAELLLAPALLKIDVQGYELEVLKGAGEHLTAFQAVVLEVSHEALYEGAPTSAELATWLFEHGFTLKQRVDAMYHPKEPRRLLQSDELWVRKS